MRKTVILFLALALALTAVGVAGAASEADKQAAIQSGLSYLASTQLANGSWAYGGNERASTAAALLAFSEQKLKPGGWFGTDYTAQVNSAANYLLQQTKLFTYPGANWGGFTGAGYGFEWYGGDRNRSTYESGLTIPALSRYAASLPGLGVNTVIGGTGNALVDGKTYAQVIQRGVDSFVWGQRGPGNQYYGGWRYHPQWTDADNSTAQWPPIAMLYAQSLAGATVPSQTQTALINWIKYVQNPNGGSGYDSPTYLVNEAKTGGLLIEMVFANRDTALDGKPGQAGALSYLNTNWLTTANSTWDGNFAHPYAMWSIYKGLESTIGLDDMTTITNLHANPGDIDNPNHGWNWWEDYCEYLVNGQNTNGSWTGYSSWYGPLATAWNINILNATAVPPPVPLPGTVGLLGTGLFGLLGAGWWRRRKN